MSRVTFEGKLLSETVVETFDFTSRLTSAETISTAAVTSVVYSGTDASPSAIVSGAASISGKKVTQKVTGGLIGVTYLLKCTITTSLGQTLALSAYLVVVPEGA